MSDDLVNWHYDKFKEGPEDFDDLHDKAVAEIDRLKAELEEAKADLYRAVSANGLYSQQASNLERQLDASQALLAEAEYQIEKQTIETRAATQLASDYIKQLAEAMAEIEKLTIYRDFAQSESSDAAITRAEAWNAGRKLTAYEILDIVARSVGNQSQLYKQICTDYKLEGVRDELHRSDQFCRDV